MTDNGGFAQTALLAAGSPAASLGVSVSYLENLAETFSPAIPKEIITQDQTGKSRNGKTAMGAAIPE